jgi:hypothetical protein
MYFIKWIWSGRKPSETQRGDRAVRIAAGIRAEEPSASEGDGALIYKDLFGLIGVAGDSVVVLLLLVEPHLAIENPAQ